MFSGEFCELFKSSYFVVHLQMTDSETPVRGSLFNKVVRLTTWRLLTELERDCCAGYFFSVNFEKLLGKIFCGGYLFNKVASVTAWRLFPVATRYCGDSGFLLDLHRDIDQLPRKHLLVFKTSSTRLQGNNFSSSKTSWRRLEDVLMKSW